MFPLNTNNIVALLGAGAVLSFVLGGLALMIQARSLARLLLVGGVGLAILAGVGPSLPLAAHGIAPMDVAVAVSGLLGIAFLAGRRPRTGLALIWPPISRWLLWPFLAPYLWANWGLVLLVVAPFSVFILIWLLQRLLTPIYGPRAAGHVTGEYLVRALDGTGRLLVDWPIQRIP